MAGPGCPKDGFKVVQDGVKVVHTHLLWEILATPSCYKVLHWPIIHDAKCGWGSVRLYFHKTEALRASGPRLFTKMTKNRKQRLPQHIKNIRKKKLNTIYTQDPQLQGWSECMPSFSHCQTKSHQCFSLSPLFSDKLFSLSGRELHRSSTS